MKWVGSCDKEGEVTQQRLGQGGKTAGGAPVVAALAALLILAGCASTHGLKPQADLTGADSLAASRALAGASVDPAAWPAQDWWTRFGDPQLDQLIHEALVGSPSLRVALARARQASAAANQATAARSPRGHSRLSAARQRFP